MAIRAPNWIKQLFGLDFADKSTKAKIKAQAESLRGELAARELAWQMCVNVIAKTFSRCQMMTYEKGERYKGKMYYLLNVRPNANESAAEFWEKFIFQLFNEMEALIVLWKTDTGYQLYVADRFNVDKSQAINEWTFTDIRINNMTLAARKSSDVFYFQLQDANVKSYLDQTLRMYSDLISLAYKSYKRSNSNKFTMDISRQREADAEDVSALLNEDMKVFMESDNAVLPQYEGYHLNTIATGSGVHTTRDIKALTDDQIELTAKVALVPAVLLKGEVADTSKALKDLLTLRIDPLASLVEKALNAKLYTERDFLSGTCVKIDTYLVEHRDIFSISSAVEKLVSCGFSSNEVRPYIGYDEIDEPWANAHFITKNFSLANNLLNEQPQAGGGQNDNENQNNDILPPS